MPCHNTHIVGCIRWKNKKTWSLTLRFSDMEFLEVLTEGLNRVLLVRGGGREVITIYSWGACNKNSGFFWNSVIPGNPPILLPEAPRYSQTAVFSDDIELYALLYVLPLNQRIFCLFIILFICFLMWQTQSYTIQVLMHLGFYFSFSPSLTLLIL